eukprot:10217990-Lingulodinium_polyedra.AAC.1
MSSSSAVPLTRSVSRTSSSHLKYHALHSSLASGLLFKTWSRSANFVIAVRGRFSAWRRRHISKPFVGETPFT